MKTLKHIGYISTLILLALLFISSYKEKTNPPITPLADFHTHLRSEAATDRFVQILKLIGEEIASRDTMICTADKLITVLNSANIKKATVLSVAYIFSFPDIETNEEYQKVQAENDWVAEQVALYPERLIGFCGINPLKEYAISEIQRCSQNPHIKGLKLHFTNSDVDLSNDEHINKLKEVFSVSNSVGFPIVIHMRTRNQDYGYEEATTFIEELLPLAPDVTVQVAHMAGWGGYDPPTDNAMNAFSYAAENKTLGKNVFFDISYIVPPMTKKWEQGTTTLSPHESEIWQNEAGSRLAAHIRKIGIDRFLFGTDWMQQEPSEYLDILHERMPLTTNELNNLLMNTAPYLNNN